MKFTWDPSKAKRNLRKHKISFEQGRNVFNDPYVVIVEDCQTAEGEMRYHAIGHIKVQLLAVLVFIDLTEDEEATHILSVRKADAFEESIYANQFN